MNWSTDEKHGVGDTKIPMTDGRPDRDYVNKTVRKFRAELELESKAKAKTRYECQIQIQIQDQRQENRGRRD